MAKVSFMKQVHNTSKMKSLKSKRNKLDVQRKKLASEYKKLVKSESRRLSKILKSKKKR